MFEMLVDYDVQKVKNDGIMEGKLELARNLLKEGIDISIIIKASGLPVEEVKKLKESSQH